MTEPRGATTSVTLPASQPGSLQDQITQFWNWRSATQESGALAIRSEEELQVWAAVMRGLLPTAPAASSIWAPARVSGPGVRSPRPPRAWL